MLKFCYLCLVVFFISCANETKKKEESNHENAVESVTEVENRQKTILFFGNSLTAGMGLEIEEAFPALIQKKLDSMSVDFKVINAGLSGETTASGKNRLSWVLKQKVDIFVLELGANDGLRGIELNETRNNLQTIIDKVREHNPEVKILLTGMQIPPNMGQDYTHDFKMIFPDLAKKNEIRLVPFLLEDVAGIPEMNQADGIHPTAEGQAILADNVWEVLQTMI
ncbi:arylesterase [Lutimonas saemankumensis]|nr:arylesterase [Lutimonas saemankumensis]MCA0930902.1 arylesterase [Lutimonas saemankumensis]